MEVDSLDFTLFSVELCFVPELGLIYRGPNYFVGMATQRTVLLAWGKKLTIYLLLPPGDGAELAWITQKITKDDPTRCSESKRTAKFKSCYTY